MEAPFFLSSSWKNPRLKSLILHIALSEVLTARFQGQHALRHQLDAFHIGDRRNIRVACSPWIPAAVRPSIPRQDRRAGSAAIRCALRDSSFIKSAVIVSSSLRSSGGPVIRLHRFPVNDPHATTTVVSSPGCSLVNLAAFRTECRRHTCRLKERSGIASETNSATDSHPGQPNLYCRCFPTPACVTPSLIKYQRITLLNLEPALADLLVLDETLVFLQLHHMTTAQKNASRVIIFN